MLKFVAVSFVAWETCCLRSFEFSILRQGPHGKREDW